ncbi:hypothetical protein BVX94_01215 [bacterium B17]|nr:hypothetical protein BVX94_01215 [bacterium B17]
MKRICAIVILFASVISLQADIFKSKSLVKTEVEPASIVKVDKMIFVDFGKAAFGRVRFEATAENDKQVVIVHIGEVLDKRAGNRINRRPGGHRRYYRQDQKLKKGTHWYEVTIPPTKRHLNPRAIQMPKETGIVHPFRYCELENYKGELTKDKIRQVRVTYPFDDEASYFKSSSKVLNDVWEMCKYSIKATSFCGVYIDGDRERIPYEGDAYINQIAHYCLDSEYALARRSLEYLIDNGTWPVEWHQHIPLMVHEEYMYTGDTGFLKERYDDIVAKMLLPLQREDGLLSINAKAADPEFLKTISMTRKLETLVDWPWGERDRHQFKQQDSVVNAFLYRNLVVMAELAEAIGKKDDAKKFKAEAERVYETYQKVFFIEDKGIYRDGPNSGHSSIHANLFPLAFGLVSEEKQEKVLAHLESKGMACSVYAAQHLVDGFYKAGAQDYALSLLTSTKERSWAHMIYDVGSTISLEAWDNKFKPNQDWNHAWGAAPADLIPRRLMGIMPIEPGFKKARIQPQIGNLTEAAIKHPTLLGPIEMEINRKGDKWKVEISIPKKMKAEFIQPWDGKPVKLKSGKNKIKS